MGGEELPLYGGWRMHSGTDFFAAWNDTIYATGNGLVSKS